jgi:antirestriction protein ArdC
MNKNYITKIEYKGGNQETLKVIKQKEGFSSEFWLTFVQARNSGLKIKKGSKGVKLIAVTEEEVAKEGSKNTITNLIKYFVVFNLDQTEAVTNE